MEFLEFYERYIEVARLPVVLKSVPCVTSTRCRCWSKTGLVFRRDRERGESVGERKETMVFAGNTIYFDVIPYSHLN